MLISISNDTEHAAELERTGFWGKRGAGSLVLSLKTRRILIAHRSQYVEQPGTWGTWGGAIDPKEQPEQAARRELVEEAGIHNIRRMIPLFVFKHHSGFQYHNFLALTDEEETPKLDWESQGFRWVEFGDWPHPMHPGLIALLDDRKSVQIIENLTRTLK